MNGDWLKERIESIEKVMIDRDPTSDPQYHYMRGQRDLMRQLLERQPDDEDEPVTEEWLAERSGRGAGDEWYQDYLFRAGGLDVTVRIIRANSFSGQSIGWVIGTMAIPFHNKPKTRGQARRLLSALGYTGTFLQRRDNVEQHDALLLSRADQNWEQAKAYLPEFGRLVLTGAPQDEGDRSLIRKACALVVAECILRKHQSQLETTETSVELKALRQTEDFLYQMLDEPDSIRTREIDELLKVVQSAINGHPL